MFNYYSTVLKKYATFEGRSTRSEYWYFTLANFIISLAFNLLPLLGLSGSISFAIVTIYALAVILPSVAVGVRRLHDTNHSGWWMFIGLVPIVGFIVLIVLFATDSDLSDNQYGANPKLIVPAVTTA